MALFIAADGPLPTIEWKEAVPAFNVRELTETDQTVRRQFSKRHVYFVGAHTGCSCGFVYGQTVVANPADEAEDAAGRVSVDTLREYLRNAVKDGGEVELFSSWESDWEGDADQRLDVSPDWFGGDEFALPERVAFRVSRRLGVIRPSQ